METKKRTKKWLFLLPGTVLLLTVAQEISAQALKAEYLLTEDAKARISEKQDISVTRYGDRLHWSPDGKSIAFAASFIKQNKRAADESKRWLTAFGIGKINADGSGLEIVTSNQLTSSHRLRPPGGNYGEDEDDVERQIRLRSKQKEIAQYPGGYRPTPAPKAEVIKPIFSLNTKFAWTNDGRIIFIDSLYSINSGNDLYLWTVSGDGANLRQILKSNDYHWPRRPYTLKSGKIAFLISSDADPVKKTAGGPEYWHSLDPNTGRIEKLTNKSSYDLNPFPDKGRNYSRQHCLVSPDGKKFLFHGEKHTKRDIYVVDLDRKSTINLTNVERGYCYSPSWSADSKRVVFLFGAILQPEESPPPPLWIINADGTGIKPIDAGLKKDEQIEDVRPALSPDGKKVAFLKKQKMKDNSQSIAVVTVGD